MSDELKPCPFCGGPANESTERVGISTWLTFVKCWSCAFDMQMSKWNRRPIEDALRAEIAALKSKLAFYEECAQAPLMKTVMDERDRLREVVRAADAYRARVSEIYNSDTQRGIEGLAHAHGFCWPADLNWVNERDAYDAARAKVTV